LESEQASAKHFQETQDKVSQVKEAFQTQLRASDFESETQIQQLKDKLKSSDAPDIEVLEKALSDSVEQYQIVEQQWQEASSQLSQLTTTQSAIVDIDNESAVLEKEYSVIGTLSDVANGQTGDKISLQRFVLSGLLDDVLLAADKRLQLMSKDRYMLLRKQLKAKGNKASGLEQEVEDSYTSKTRPVSTLSGGESFKAALSMALGLSDVVHKLTPVA